MQRSKFVLSLLAGAASTLLPAAVQAQETVATSVEEIVVTAQRRAERYVDVPASVSVVSAAQLGQAGISDSRELRLLTPGLNITTQGTYVQPTIRGVGTTVTGTGADPNVAVYVDGVYLASQGSALFAFNNIEQIEVLKGPQGTLYGRNATGGAIVVTTKAPSLGEFNGNAQVSYGRFDELRMSGYVNVPVSDKVAFNIAGYNNSNDGYTYNVALNEKSSFTESSGLRARVLFQPIDDLRIILTGTHINQSDNTAYSYVPINNNTPFRNSLAAQLGASGNRDRIALNTRPTNKLDYTSANLNVDWTGSWGTLTSITSWAETEFPFYTDLDGTELNVQAFRADPQWQKTRSQELIYTSTEMGRFSWIGGLYYYEDEAYTDVQISVNGAALPFPPFRPAARVKAQAYAAYAEGTFDLTERLHLTAGGRYSWEEKHATNEDSPGGALLVDATESWDAFTPHVALRYDLSPSSSAYVSYSQGFKSGLFDAGAIGTCTTPTNPTCPFEGDPVEPEKVRSYEVGYKYNARGTVFSAAAYFTEYKNIQINALNEINQQILYNAAAAEIYGVELEGSAYLTDELFVRAGAAYTHSEYTDFPLAQLFVPLPQGGNQQMVGDASGNELIRTPEFTAFLSGTHTEELAFGTIETNVTASYSDSFYHHVDNRLKQPSFAILNARVSWIAPSERWRLIAYGENLTNERTMMYVREAVVGDFASFSKPRTYGIGVAVNF